MKVVLFLFMSVILFSCKTKKDVPQLNTEAVKNHQETIEEEPYADYYKKLEGRWIWLKTSCCGRVPKETNPQTTGFTIEFDFKPDKTFDAYRDGKLEKTLPYKLGNYIFNETRPLMVMGESPRPAYILFRSDTLVIDYGYMDLETEYYIRKK